jgi:hypothetical protein
MKRDKLEDIALRMIWQSAETMNTMYATSTVPVVLNSSCIKFLGLYEGIDKVCHNHHTVFT